MRAKLRDTEIYFDVDGAALVPDGVRMRERPSAFLIHGGPGQDHTPYKGRYSVLKEKMQLIYFDLRGHGRSARSAVANYTLDENVEDIEALRQYLGLGPIVSVGGSYGGMVAMAHAARFPDAVSHLIIFATAAHSGYVAKAKKLVSERGSTAQIALCEDLFAGRIDTPDKMKHYFEVMGSLYSCSFDPQTAKASADRAILSPEAQNNAHGPSGFLRSFDLRPELHSITAPTLILAGRHDWICAPEFSEEIQQLIPDSDLRIFENSSHMIAADEPQAFFDAIAGSLVYKSRRKV
jgi:proline iminopeptidase